jgi:hypothetical protein
MHSVTDASYHHPVYRLLDSLKRCKHCPFFCTYRIRSSTTNMPQAMHFTVYIHVLQC